jgi:phosphate transport system substrate-binding protein
MASSIAKAPLRRRGTLVSAGVVLAVCGLLTIGCARKNAAPALASAELKRFQGLSGAIAIAGGTAHLPVMNEAVRRISAVNPDIRITVGGGGSGVGVKMVGEGLVDIGNTGRAITEKERAAYGLIAFPFALDGVSIVVHPSNPVAALSAEQMKKLYSGEIVDWSDVGGPKGAVHLIMRDEASGTREVFWETLLGKGPIKSGAIAAPSNGAVRVAVGNDPLAIGYTSMGHVDETVKAIAIDGHAPTHENAVSGKYPVVRKLFMNTKGRPSELVQAFIDYLRGPEGDAIVRGAGFIPIKE